MDQPPVNKYWLYEHCVQSPTDLVPLLEQVHGNAPKVLGEDFCGTAALAHAWAASDPGRRAVGVDLDGGALGYRAPHERVLLHQMDVRDATDPSDVLFVGNFSIGYLHTRADLLCYLRAARARLDAAGPGGVFVCDTYGGESSFRPGAVHRDHWITGEAAPAGLRGARVRYTWEQRSADPITARVVDVLHFRVIDVDGVIIDEIDDAFVYDWRLWSVPELGDAMRDAGFGGVEVYDKVPGAIDAEGGAHALPIADGSELDESFIVLVAARA